MTIGLPKEIKDNEYRVAITPGGVRQLVDAGHRVLAERGAGEGSGFTDNEYRGQGPGWYRGLLTYGMRTL
jgi:alanine dehydrogenase